MQRRRSLVPGVKTAMAEAAREDSSRGNYQTTTAQARAINSVSERGLSAARAALARDKRYPMNLSIADCVTLVVAEYLTAAAKDGGGAAAVADRYTGRKK